MRFRTGSARVVSRVRRRKLKKRPTPESPLGIEATLHGFHRLDVLSRVLNSQELGFALPEAMLCRYRAAELDTLAGENGQGLGSCVELGLSCRQHIHVRMAIAHVAKDAVVAWHDPIHMFTVEHQHLAVPVDRHGKIRSKR